MISALPLAALLLLLPAIPSLKPRGYACQRASGPIKIDGMLDKPAWAKAPWSEDFLDIEGDAKPRPRFRTRMKMLWDDEALFIGAEMEEPQLKASLTEHDSVIFHDNDFEVFLDPDDDGQMYTELEMNALNTTWDLLLPKPYRAGGPPLDGWELKGLQTAVHLDGHLNDPSKESKGWSVEIRLPWEAIYQTSTKPCPPKDGDVWRINFSRVEWQFDDAEGKLVKRPNTPEDNWVWSPMGVIDMHRPERWGYLQFTERTESPPALKPFEGWSENLVLGQIWEKQSEFLKAHGRYAKSAKELGWNGPDVRIQATDHLFEASYRGFHVDQSLRFWK